MSDTMLFYTLTGIVGAAIGSFLNVCVARWPLRESVVAPRSRCPRCGHQITWWENIPVISWLVLRARCSGCGLPISVQYPLVELAVAGLWVAAVWLMGPTLVALRLAVFATLLFGVLLTDLLAYDIPDGFTITGLLVALAGAFADVFTSPGGAWPFASFPDALIGACTGAGIVAIAGWLGEAWLKREAMGFGDVTLMAMVGAFVGPWRSLITVFLGAAIGLVVMLALAPFLAARATATPAVSPTEGPASDSAPEPVPSSEGSDSALAHAAGERPDVPPPGAWGLPAIPFGVFLAPGALVALLAGDRIIVWYLATSGLR